MRMSRDNLIVLGILFVVTVTYLLVIYRSQSAALNEARERRQQMKRRLEADSRTASQLAPMLREIQAMRQRYNKDWDRKLPQRQELAGFLREISGNLARHRLSNQMIEPGNPKQGPLYNCLPITMSFEGDFLALAGFLQEVDRMTRLTRIESLRIQSSKDSEDLSIKLGMNIYFTEQ